MLWIIFSPVTNGRRRCSARSQRSDAAGAAVAWHHRRLMYVEKPMQHPSCGLLYCLLDWQLYNQLCDVVWPSCSQFSMKCLSSVLATDWITTTSNTASVNVSPSPCPVCMCTPPQGLLFSQSSLSTRAYLTLSTHRSGCWQTWILHVILWSSEASRDRNGLSSQLSWSDLVRRITGDWVAVKRSDVIE